jgi:homotetrameric cytidine deaminase
MNLPPALSSRDTALLKSARRAATHSYSPYSRFPVGAALRTDTGRIFQGSNVENASYGLTLCAERTALGAAVAEGRRRFTALAIVGGRREAARPCGACLQVLAEFCGPDFPILVAPLDPRRKAERFALKDLLPHAFALKPRARDTA